MLSNYFGLIETGLGNKSWNCSQFAFVFDGRVCWVSGSLGWSSEV